MTINRNSSYWFAGGSLTVVTVRISVIRLLKIRDYLFYILIPTLPGTILSTLHKFSI